MAVLKVITHCLFYDFNSFDLCRWVFHPYLISAAYLCFLGVFCCVINTGKKSELYCFSEMTPCKKKKDVLQMKISGIISARWNVGELLFVVFRERKIWMHGYRRNKQQYSFHDSIFKKWNIPFTTTNKINSLQLHWAPPVPLAKALKARAFSVPHQTLWFREWLSVHWFFLSDAQELGKTGDSKKKLDTNHHSSILISSVTKRLQKH